MALLHLGKIVINNSGIDPLMAAALKLTEVLEGALNAHQPVLLLLSGGSSLKLLDLVKTELLVGDLTLTALDERYDTDPKINNWAQIITTRFFQTLNSVKVIDTQVQNGETQSASARRFNQELQTWLSEHPQGTVVATMGIGPDGHISGMMPFPEAPEKFNELFETGGEENFVRAYDAGHKNEFPLRVTTTMNWLRKIEKAIVYAAGNNKVEALRLLAAPTGSLANTPARILLELPQVYLFTDQQLN